MNESHKAPPLERVESTARGILLRRPSRLRVENFGPIKKGEVTLGGLTVLVGPQATGKSIFLQLLKLLVDTKYVRYEFRRAGIDWRQSFSSFLDVYFGEGMRSLYDAKRTAIEFNGTSRNLEALVAGARPARGESMFFVPAQRVLTLRDGWPQAFTHYDPGVPFAVREFSEELRLMMTKLSPDEALFPYPRRLKQEFRELLQQHVFPGFDLEIDAERTQKRLVLSPGEDSPSLPFMVWSAGQREFVPLLLSLYHLLTPAGAPRRRGVDWVVIEELEMGLHPRAISIVMLMVFELVSRGYRVCISTHSPQVLDAVWALRHLSMNEADPGALLRVFDAPQTPGMLALASGVMKRSARVYYFDREGGNIRDISTLDPEQEEIGESGWGGLSEFSGRANAEVAKAIADHRRKAHS